MKHFLRGWNENNWQNTFLAVLLLTIGIALVISYVLPSLQSFLVGLAVCVSLFWAGVKDGPKGKLGFCIWSLIVLLTIVTMFVLMLILPRPLSSVEVRLAGYGFKIEVESQASEECPPIISSNRRGFKQNVIWT